MNSTLCAVGVALACSASSAAAHAASTAPAESRVPPAVEWSAAPLRLTVPVAGVRRGDLRNSFAERRGNSLHEAIDIAAPRGTPVVAAAPGRIAKLFTSAAGGLTLYQFDDDERYALYYAHLDRYGERVREGMRVQRGELIGYVGATGNARADSPHLHFAVFRLGADKAWWKGTAVDAFRWFQE